MEKYMLHNDIHLICLEAESFPNGVMAAHQKLHGMLSNDLERTFYGLSRPNKEGTIVYKAAAKESYEGEAKAMNCEMFVLPEGEYISIFIKDFCDDVPAIGNAFQQLIARPDIDPNGICVEEYINDKDVRCMVKLKA